jgi:hypothetical protein
MKVGTIDINDLKSGDTQISKVFNDTTLIWEKTTNTIKDFWVGVTALYRNPTVSLMTLDIFVRTVSNFGITRSNIFRTIDSDANGNIYLVGNRIDNFTTYKMNSNGVIIWQRDHGAQVNTIKVDNEGNVYTAGNVNAGSFNMSTRKYDSNGNLLWSVNHGAAVNEIALDNNGHLYTTGNRASSITTRKLLTSNGGTVWSRDHGANTNSIDVSANGFGIFVGGAHVSGIGARQYNSSGDLEASFETVSNGLNSNVNSIRYNNTRQTIYLAGQNGLLRGVNSSGTVLWDRLHWQGDNSTIVTNVNRILIDETRDLIYVSGNTVNNTTGLFLYNLWNQNKGPILIYGLTTTQDFCLNKTDNDGTIYRISNASPSGGDAPSQPSLYKINNQGNLIGSIDVFTTVFGIKYKNGDIYLASRSGELDLFTIGRQWNSQGHLIQRKGLLGFAAVNSEATSIDIDSNGNIFLGVSSTTSSIIKYNPSTSPNEGIYDILWTYAHSAVINSIVVDSNGDVYAAGNRGNNISTVKLNGFNGSIIWTADHGTFVNSITMDSNGNIYTGGQWLNSISCRKYSPNGTLLLSFSTLNETVHSIKVDAFGNLYTGSGFNLRKFDALGNMLWIVNTGGNVRGMDIDSNGNIYINGTNTMPKVYNTNGELLLTANFGLDSTRIAVVE